MLPRTYCFILNNWFIVPFNWKSIEDHAQGGAQALEDAAALSVILSNVTDTSLESLHGLLNVFERVRLKRASVVQISSNIGMDEAWKVRGRLQAFMGTTEVPGKY